MENKAGYQAIDCTVSDCRFNNTATQMCQRRSISIGKTHCEFAWCDSYESRV
ncbi:MAG: DUF1540 domain-containing protein [Firmicutes bacterium]|nr:DUF1540 domain-containing protein [Bacillota bacterium]